MRQRLKLETFAGFFLVGARSSARSLLWSKEQRSLRERQAHSQSRERPDGRRFESGRAHQRNTPGEIDMPRLKSAGRVSGAWRNSLRLELVVAGCVVRNGKILLVWHKKNKEWLPPGGHIEQNESPNAAVLREVKEETGLVVAFMDRPKSPSKYISKQLVSCPLRCLTGGLFEKFLCVLRLAA